MTDSQTTALHYIDSLPFDANAEILRQYPAFKLGVTASVRHYAQLLLPEVKRVTATESGCVMTSPALASQTPAAANLLCWELMELYGYDSNELCVMDIQYDNEATASIDYAKLDLAERVTARQRLSSRLIPNGGFRGQPVIFINDICVTGTQQRALQQYFDSVGAAYVRWLYLIFVDPEIGKAQPELEWQINFASFEELLRLVSREEIQFTGKCVLKLMQLSLEEFDQVLRALTRERRKRLLELALRNGFGNMQNFREHVKHLRG
jgi:phosphoribosyl transferase-like protein